MKSLGPSRYALTIGAAAAMLAGCGGNMASPQVESHSIASPENAHSGPFYLYVGTSNAILGYRGNNRRGRPPICKLDQSSTSGIAVDASGNFIDTDTSGSVTVFKGPKMCGAKLGSLQDQYGTPVDVTSANAVTGVIVVANLFSNSGAGSLSVCKLFKGCTKNLTNSNMYYVGGVALANNGDCWASATDYAGAATLTYFKGCSGSGRAATHYGNTNDGGLDIDGEGNLVSISSDGKLYVYKGCNPVCALVGGPFRLSGGEAFFGHLNKDSTTLATSDFENGSVDIYAYSPTSLTYKFSFNNGLGISNTPTGIAYNPRSKE